MMAKARENSSAGFALIELLIAMVVMTGAQVIVPPIISSFDNTPPGPSIRSITRATATLNDM